MKLALSTTSSEKEEGKRPSRATNSHQPPPSHFSFCLLNHHRMPASLSLSISRVITPLPSSEIKKGGRMFHISWLHVDKTKQEPSMRVSFRDDGCCASSNFIFKKERKEVLSFFSKSSKSNSRYLYWTFIVRSTPVALYFIFSSPSLEHVQNKRKEIEVPKVRRRISAKSYRNFGSYWNRSLDYGYDASIRNLRS